jgi:hypothetical protein
MSSEKGFPEEIENPNEDGRGVPVKVNDNKPSTFLQGSGHLVEEVDGPLQMMEGVNAKEKIDGMIFAGKGIS